MVGNLVKLALPRRKGSFHKGTPYLSKGIESDLLAQGHFKISSSLELLALRQLPPTFDIAVINVLIDAFCDYPAWYLVGCTDEQKLRAIEKTYYQSIVALHRNSIYVLLHTAAESDVPGGRISANHVVGVCCAWNTNDKTEQETILSYCLNGMYRFPQRHGLRWLKNLIAVGNAIDRSLYEENKERKEPRWKIDYVAVAKPWSGKGLGKQMLKALLVLLESRDSSMYIELITHHERNVPFYRGLGFDCPTAKTELRANGICCSQWYFIKGATATKFQL